MSPVIVRAAVPEIDLSLLRFRVETNPDGPAIDLVWDVPEQWRGRSVPSLTIVRRERRFPGRGRRGVVAVTAGPADRADGRTVFAAESFDYDLEETQEELLDGVAVRTTRQYLFRGEPRDRVLVRSIRRELDATWQDIVRETVRVVDRADLVAQATYYYTAFETPSGRYSRATQGSALATGRAGPRLFEQLPRIDRRRDTELPAPATVARAYRGQGQLERFLGGFEAHCDMLHGYVESLRDLHVPRAVDSRLLGALAHLIGWKLKDYLDEDGQRNEIAFAPQVYQTVGTIPNLAAMVNRLTGWDATVWEFARNVVLTWDRTRRERLDAGPAYLDGSARPVADPQGTLPPTLDTKPNPRGSLDVNDAASMFALRNRSPGDTNCYTYDCGVPDGLGGYDRSDAVLYNRETLAVYVIPEESSDVFVLQQEADRIKAILRDFLPIGIRAVFFVMPGTVVEDPYDATRDAADSVTDAGTLIELDHYGAGVDTHADTMAGWHWLVSNVLAARTVNTAVAPVDTSWRTRHVGVEAGP
jgi:phage tail-like protein